jgi:hypothetical protein
MRDARPEMIDRELDKPDHSSELWRLVEEYAPHATRRAIEQRELVDYWSLCQKLRRPRYNPTGTL